MATNPSATTAPARTMTASPVAVPRVPTGALKVRELVPEGSIVEPGQIVIVFDDTRLNIELDSELFTQKSIKSWTAQEMRDLVFDYGITVTAEE